MSRAHPPVLRQMFCQHSWWPSHHARPEAGHSQGWGRLQGTACREAIGLLEQCEPEGATFLWNRTTGDKWLDETLVEIKTRLARTSILFMNMCTIYLHLLWSFEWVLSKYTSTRFVNIKPEEDCEREHASWSELERGYSSLQWAPRPSCWSSDFRGVYFGQILKFWCGMLLKILQWRLKEHENVKKSMQIKQKCR